MKQSVESLPEAAMPQDEDSLRDLHQYLTFVLGSETFAIGILRIKEIIEFGGVTTVPMMPPCIRGVINLRGAVVPVVDLSVRFGRPQSEATRRTCVVILETESNGEAQDVGIIVDAVNEVLDIPDAEIEPVPSFGTSVRPDLIQGMGKVDGRFVIILDTDRVLAAEEMLALEGAVDRVSNDAEFAVGQRAA